MADNYLEKKMEELEHPRPVVHRHHPSLDSLLRKNRSYRGYDPSRVVTRQELEEIVAVNRFCASGMNRQTLRFRLVTEEEADKVLPHLTMACELQEERLPYPGTEPRAFIVITSTARENRIVHIDLGIAAQSMMLKAVEMGLNGIFLLNIYSSAIREALGMDRDPIAVIALGKGTENIFITPAKAGDSLVYYRKDGNHYVPKLRVEDLLLPGGENK